MTEIDQECFLRLCRRTVRKGYAFPAKLKDSEAAPPQVFRGRASWIELDIRSVSQRLTALCGGKAALLIVVFLLLSLLTTISCQRPQLVLNRAKPSPSPTPVAKSLPATASPELRLFIDGAVAQSKVTTGYDPAWVRIDYPNGDVPPETGVCSDVIVRAFRKAGIDLQKEVHEDMTRAWSVYPKKWGARGTDTNIDHRRVLNLTTFFEREGKSLPISDNRANYLPGDIVAWELSNGVEHIGIMTDLWSEPDKHCLAVHNIGAGARIEDVLFNWKIIGHYRYFK